MKSPISPYTSKRKTVPSSITCESGNGHPHALYKHGASEVQLIPALTMAKIKTIRVQNLKAVEHIEGNFKGCSAIITGGNNKGKTTLLRCFMDRMQRGKADQILRHGSSEGFSEIELTTGEKFRWELKGDKERLTYISDKNIPSNLTKAIQQNYFPPVFDIDAFLHDTPAKQRATLQKISGIDFTEMDAAYKLAFEQRTWANKVKTEAAAKATLPHPGIPANEISVVELSERLARAEKTNATRDRISDGIKDRETRLAAIESERTTCPGRVEQSIAAIQEALQRKIAELTAEAEADVARITGAADDALAELQTEYETKSREVSEGNNWLQDMKNAAVDTDDLQQQIRDAETKNREIRANNLAQESQINLRRAEKDAKDADDEVKRIEAEKADALKSSSLPTGFGFTEDGITYNGLPFSRENQSSSATYIAALKLAALGLGEVKTLHFDASYLDRNSLAEIEAWANEQGLQLLIERPDFDGGEISYQLINETADVTLVQHDSDLNTTLFEKG